MCCFLFGHGRGRGVKDQALLLNIDARLRIDRQRQGDRLQEGRLELPDQLEGCTELSMQ